ncbi:MAG: TetR/AcrR family transcriptional regulator [Caulobacterales bacterium]|nr:TetR/AcrR family transcriptional regulator [Caulobacterales bacterium]
MKINNINEPNSTERFLQAAEDLYIENGYQSTTIRKICEKAGVSLAILHRHWPNKEALFLQVFKRHFDPIHKEQFEAFAQVLANKNADELIKAQDVLIAFYRPAFKRGQEKTTNSHALYCRALLDPAIEAKKLVAQLIGEARNKLIELLKAALPGISQYQLFLILNLVLACYVFPQAFSHQMAVATNFDDKTMNWEQIANDISHMICNGIYDI